MSDSASREIPVPVVHQHHDFDCAPAALRAVALYYGVDAVGGDELLRLCRTSPADGTDPEDLVAAARALRLHAAPREGLSVEWLKEALDDGKPVICLIQAWGDRTGYPAHEWEHYVLAVGYDEGHVLFEDPGLRAADTRGRMTYEEFARRWHGLGRGGKVLRQCGIVVWGDEPREEASAAGRTRTTGRLRRGRACVVGGAAARLTWTRHCQAGDG